jgi:ethanolamine-phosphate cytidylyltransferase
MHYGHANALRQAKLMGDYLIVGVHSDAEILKHKGPTVIKEQDRYAAVRACKWVDEVVEDAPYTTEVEYLDKYKCDFCVHGDDVTTTSDGSDCYALVKQANRYKECKRTGGVSTSDLVARMLYRKEHPKGRNYSEDYNAFNESSKGITKTETVLDTIKTFSEGSKQPKSSDEVTKISGSFDMFHAKHSFYFESIKKDYLIVGIQSDEFVFKTTGQYPILNLYERALCVLSCRVMVF